MTFSFFYTGFIIAQIWKAIKYGVVECLIYIGLLISLHIITALGVQFGMFKGILKRIGI